MAKIIVNNPRQVINGGAKKYYFKVKGLGGPKGDKGDKGDTGSQGPQGPQGNAATVSVGSTATLPVGYDATVTNSGSIYNAVLDFGIPQGPRGPQGATGAKGDKGDKGDQGNPGPQGEKGTNATVYVGTTSTLNPGSQATVYNSGTDSNAVLNFGIPKGEKGDTGPMPTIAQTTGQATDQVMSQKATTDALNTKQATITSSNKLSADLVDDTSTTNKFVTASDITNWNAKQDALTAGNNIDITDGVISTPAIAPEVVAELPATGTEGKLYLTPKAHTTQTATGNPIEATVTEQAGQLESFQLDGDTFQQTYTGKNLLRLSDGATTLGGVPITTTNGTVNLKGTATSYEQGYYVSIGITASEPMVFTTNESGTTSGLVIKLQYKRGGMVYYPTVGSSLSLQAGDIIQQMYLIITNGSVVDGSFSPMLEVGSTATSFEPYVGGQPSPSPEYPQPIQTVTGRQIVNVTGKNLLRLPYTGGTVGTGLTWTVADDGTVHVVGTIGGGYKSYYLYNRSQSDFDMPEIPAGTYKVFWDITGSGSSPRITIQDTNGYHNSNTSNEVTIATSAKPTAIYIQFTSSQSGDVDLYIKPMIVPSDQADVYEPYSSNDYEINLGKNLLDMSQTWVRGTLNDSSVEVQPNNNTILSDYIKVEPNTTYVFSQKQLGGKDVKPNIVSFFKDKVNARTGRQQVLNSSPQAFTTSNDTYYIRVGYYNPTGLTLDTWLDYVTNLQLEAGSTASDYAPYFEPIELCKLGTYQDYIYKDGDDWKVHKAVAKHALKPNEGWLIPNPASYPNLFQTNAISDLGNLSDAYTAAATSPQAYCEALVYLPGSGDVRTTQGFSLYRTTEGGVMYNIARINIAGFTTTTQLNNWLSTCNASFWYGVKKPTDTTITDTTLIAQLEAVRTALLQNGTNTITNTATGSNLAGDMEIGYYGYNPTNRYNKFIWLDLNNNYEQIGGE